jgi:hypothetical protein
MVFAIPPTVILVPTTLAFGIQIAAAIIGIAAVLALVMNRSVQSCFRLFDGMLALGVVISARLWRRRYDQAQRSCRQRRYCCLSYFLNQGFYPLFPFVPFFRLRNLTDCNQAHVGVSIQCILY